ncbi:hypothetical protein MMC24_006886 [Lignoscripta atroalba]|nr:hypothetical protein [Lignoscripta atroalba]
MSALIPTTSNLSLYTIPIAYFINVITPRGYGLRLYYSRSPTAYYDNTNPRSLVTKISADQTLDQATKDRIVRAEAAQQNGVENVALFAAAVLAGNMARLDNWWLNTLSGGYLASRMVYIFVYVNNTSEGLAAARTGVFFVGLGLICTLFVQAANKLRYGW